MTEFIVEVSIPAATAGVAIDRAIRSAGSHFAARATWWRCGDTYTGALTIEAADETEARHVVPPGMGASARIFRHDVMAA